MLQFANLENYRNVMEHIKKLLVHSHRNPLSNAVKAASVVEIATREISVLLPALSAYCIPVSIRGNTLHIETESSSVSAVLYMHASELIERISSAQNSVVVTRIRALPKRKSYDTL